MQKVIPYFAKVQISYQSSLTVQFISLLIEDFDFISVPTSKIPIF